MSNAGILFSMCPNMSGQLDRLLMVSQAHTTLDGNRPICLNLGVPQSHVVELDAEF